jgi:hypothetical protein
MLKKLLASACVVAGIALLACGKTKPPKQAESADALNDKGADMSTGEEPGGNPKPAADSDPKPGEEAMHTKCCGQCKDGLAKDRSGGNAATIPCTDFTAALDPFCLEHFRGRKTMAVECK